MALPTVQRRVSETRPLSTPFATKLYATPSVQAYKTNYQINSLVLIKIHRQIYFKTSIWNSYNYISYRWMRIYIIKWQKGLLFLQKELNIGSLFGKEKHWLSSMFSECGAGLKLRRGWSIPKAPDFPSWEKQKFAPIPFAQVSVDLPMYDACSNS